MRLIMPWEVKTKKDKCRLLMDFYEHHHWIARPKIKRYLKKTFKIKSLKNMTEEEGLDCLAFLEDKYSLAILKSWDGEKCRKKIPERPEGFWYRTAPEVEKKNKKKEENNKEEQKDK